MKKFLVFTVLCLFFYNVSFSEDYEGFDNRLSKAILGINFSYVNYKTLENEIGLSINDNRFLLGFSFGYVSKGFIVDFTYAYKVFPFFQSTLSGIKVVDYFDTFTFKIGYLFTIFENYFYLGPLVIFSIDNSYLKFFNDIDFYSFVTNWGVKEINSRAFSVGGGIGITLFRNIFLGVGYLYSFPSTYYYQGVSILNSPTFNSTGFRAFLTLAL